MTIDRGGLEYTISVKDEFSAALSQFRKDAEEARNAWKGLKDELGKRASVTAKVTTEIKKTSTAQKDETKAAKASTRASKEKTKQLNVELAAQKAAAREIRRRAVLERRDAILREKGLDTGKKRAQSLTVEQEALKKANKELRNLAVAERQAQIQRERGINVAKEKIKLINAEEQAQARLAKIEKERQIAQKVFQGQGGVQGEAQRRLDAFRQEQDIEKEFERLAATQGVETPKAKRAREEAERAARAADKQAEALKRQRREQERAGRQSETFRQRLARLRGEQNKLTSGANRLSFTFRRLFGILAAFQAARAFLQFIRQALVEVFRFNSAIQDAELGIQSLIQASGQVADSQGKLVEGAEKFALANKEAKRQVALLRVEGLKTSATFDELLQAYQTALSPGLRAGLSPDQLRGFSVRIAQAAASVGLPGNQLAEEVRSILQGTIQARTTRIAVALGITNEDIRRAKEAGNLAEFLTERFDAFKLTGEAALGNFSTLLANLRNAISTVIGEAGTGLFQDISARIQSISDSLLTVTSQGIRINPQVVSVARNLLSIFRTIVAQADKISGALNISDAVKASENFADFINSIIDGVGDFAAGFVNGVRAGAELVSEIFTQVGEIVGLAEDGIFDNEALSSTLGTVGEILALVLSLRVGFLAIALPVRLILSSFTALLSILKPVQILFRSIALLTGIASAKLLIIVGVIGAIAAGIALVVAAFKNDFVRSIDIGGIKIGTLADSIALGLRIAINRVTIFFGNAWARTVATVQRIWTKFINFIADTGLAVVEAVLEAAEFVGIDTNLNAIKAARKALADETERELKAIEAKEKSQLAALKLVEDELKARERASALAILEAERNGPRRTPAEAFKEAFEEFQKLVGLTKEGEKAAEDIGEKFGDAELAVGELNTIIGRTNKTLEQSGELLDKLTKGLRDATDEQAFTRASLGIEGVALKALEVFEKQRVSIREATREFRQQENAARNSLSAINARTASLTAQADSVTNGATADVRRLARLSQEIAKISGQQQAAAQGIETATRDLSRRKAALSALEQQSLRNSLDQLKQENDARESKLALLRAEADAILGTLSAEGVERSKIVALVNELARLDGQRTLTLTEIEQIQAEIGKITESIQQRTIKNLDTILVKENQRTRLANQRLQAELRQAQFQNTNLPSTENIIGENLPGAGFEARRAIIDLLAEQISLEGDLSALNARFEIEQKSLMATLDRVRGTEAEQSALAALTLASETYTAEVLSQAEAIRENQRLLEQQQAILERPIETGFSLALEEFAAKAEDTFTQSFELGRTLIEGFTDQLSGAITDALDPTKQSQTVLQRFTTLMNQIVQIVIQSLVRLAVLKAILEPLGLGGNSTADAAIASAAAIKATTAATLAASFAAQAQAAAAAAAATSIGGIGLVGGGGFGFAAGGSPESLPRHSMPRPGNLHPSDVIPAWLGFREFVQPRHAVEKYGVEFMEMIRRGMLDPSLVGMLTGVKKSARLRVKSSKGPGFVTGGSVGRSSGQSGGASGEISIINVFDRDELVGALAERQGQEVMVNVIRSRSDDLRPAQ